MKKLGELVVRQGKKQLVYSNSPTLKKMGRGKKKIASGFFSAGT
jgi:hypothetical protein